MDNKNINAPEINAAPQTAKNNSKALIRKSKTAKIGAFNFSVMLIVLAILIFVNLAVTVLPSSITRADTSTNQTTSLTDESRAYAEKIKDKIAVYMLCNDASASSSAVLDVTGQGTLMLGTELYTYLKRFSDANNKIEIVLLDPARNPEIVNKYTKNQLSACSLIVASEKRAKVITGEDLFVYYHEALGTPISYSEYYQLLQYQYYYAQQGYDFCQMNIGINFSDIAPCFNGNTVITRAFEYVSLETVPTVYTVTNHDETALSDNLVESFKSANITLGTLELKDGIPTDTTSIIINSPKFDFTESEADDIRKYLDGGGSVILISGAGGMDSKPNLSGIMADFGLSAQAGTVYDKSSTYNQKNQLVPTLSGDSDITKNLASGQTNLLFLNCHGISIANTLPDGVSVSRLATTSESSYRVLNEAKVADSDGAYTIGACAQGKNDSRVVWFSSSEAFTDNVSYYTGYANYQLLYNSINWCGDSFETTIPQLKTSQIGAAYLTVQPNQATIMLIALAIALPLIFATIGIVVRIKRNRR